MRLTSLTLKNFRNHLDTHFDFGEGTNVLLGDNGQGKTNVIEAISYLCLTKSFYAASDALVVRFENPYFQAEGTVVSDSGYERRVRVVYSSAESKKVFSVNRQKIEPLSSVIGTFPVVICSPEHTPITTGSPADRRKFVDLVISQSNAAYFNDLLEYRRALRHRNKILLDGKISRTDVTEILEPWDEQVIKIGAAITVRRKKFIDEFQGFINTTYHHLVGEEEQPTLGYKSGVMMMDALSQQEVEDILRAGLRDKATLERKLGITLTGPHRDEIVLMINELDLRKFASQGQHKTFLVALKLAEFFYLRERCNETPLVLFDDIFSELDEQRSLRLLQFVEELNQTFVTSTTPHLFQHLMEQGANHKLFTIQNGTLVEEKSASVL
jgi:DNA replication and repair protein RecF